MAGCIAITCIKSGNKCGRKRQIRLLEALVRCRQRAQGFLLLSCDREEAVRRERRYEEEGSRDRGHSDVRIGQKSGDRTVNWNAGRGHRGYCTKRFKGILCP